MIILRGFIYLLKAFLKRVRKSIKLEQGDYVETEYSAGIYIGDHFFDKNNNLITVLDTFGDDPNNFSKNLQESLKESVDSVSVSSMRITKLNKDALSKLEKEIVLLYCIGEVFWLEDNE